MIDKIWKYRNKGLSKQSITELSEQYKIPKVIATVILNRKIENVESFLKKSMKGIHNPNLMTGMQNAVERIKKALDNNEKIVIYGDYDVDGITSTALLYEFLLNQGASVEYYIPDRKDEGYGINIMAVNRLIKQGTKLLITVDCGITAIGEVEFAKLQGMDVIITDHHTCKERLPEATAVLNPKREDCNYPFDGLAGVGVAFKLMLGIAVELGLNTTECFNEYVDIAAIGTVADVVPLVDENRIIVDKGLKLLKNSNRKGVRSILEVAGADKRELNASTIAFAVAPRLNAAGRLGTATTAVELLLTKDEAEARRIACELDRENKERQMTEQTIFDEAMELIANDVNFEKKKVIVLAKEGWHQGVIGIVASRINEKFYKPCILISHSNGIGKGSGRSIPSFNLFDALTYCEDNLLEFGGHAVAAGLNINMSELEKFTEKINKYADGVLTREDMIAEVKIDCRLTEKSINITGAKLLCRLEPFGMGNEKPVFSLEDAMVDIISTVGADGKHLKMRLVKNSVMLNCIGFNMGAYADSIRRGDRINAAFQMDINNYQGKETVQLLLKDIKKG